MLLLNGEGEARKAQVLHVDRTTVCLQNLDTQPLPAEMQCRVRLLQAIGRGDRFEHALQHGTEVGADSFVPILAQHAMTKVPQNKMAERVERWQKIVHNAAEQSCRTRIPKVEQPITLPQALNAYAEPCRLLLHPLQNAPALAAVLPENPAGILLAVGPEGGWSKEEVETALQHGCTITSLGPRTLRTETAALVALSQILYHLERRPL